MHARSLVVAGLSMLVVASLPAVAAASGYKAGTRYARCTTANPKDYGTCSDVATKLGSEYTLQFNVMRTYCDFIKPHPPRSAWTFYGPIKLKRGKLSGKLTYNNLVREAQDQPDDIEIEFTWSGKLVGSKLMRLQLKGRVTKAGSDPTVQKCKDVAFTETHVLRTVPW